MALLIVERLLDEPRHREHERSFRDPHRAPGPGSSLSSAGANANTDITVTGIATEDTIVAVVGIDGDNATPASTVVDRKAATRSPPRTRSSARPAPRPSACWSSIRTSRGGTMSTTIDAGAAHAVRGDDRERHARDAETIAPDQRAGDAQGPFAPEDVHVRGAFWRTTCRPLFRGSRRTQVRTLSGPRARVPGDRRGTDDTKPLVRALPRRGRGSDVAVQRLVLESRRRIWGRSPITSGCGNIFWERTTLALEIDGGLKEVSVRWAFDTPTCSICSSDLRECDHMPGGEL